MSTPPASSRESEIRAESSPLGRILALARVLRGPGGCPWDAEQTVESLTPYLQEETYEVVEAVGDRDAAAFREELGDLLFMVSFLALVGEETGWGTLDEVAEAVVDKLIRRHPHVFRTGEEIGAEGALRQWEELKRDEGDAAETDRSTLGSRPPGLPALTTAYRISEKAGAVGFQWPDLGGALAKLREEIGELTREIDRGEPGPEVEKELGDVLYATVNVARYLKVDPERALRGTTARFTERFRYIENALRTRGKTPVTASLEEMDALWEEAKAKGIR